jgi:hypothetical protein
MVDGNDKIARVDNGRKSMTTERMQRLWMKLSFALRLASMLDIIS